MPPELASWGSANWKWKEGNVYIRIHDDWSHKNMMVILFLVKEIKGNKVEGIDILSGIQIKLNYKSYPAQEFNPFDERAKCNLFKSLFSESHDRKYIKWFGRDSGWDPKTT